MGGESRKLQFWDWQLQIPDKKDTGARNFNFDS